MRLPVWVFHFLVIGSLVISAWILWIDATLQQHFEGYRWSLPATVYSRPLEIFPGKKITPSDLAFELNLSGYRQVTKVREAGEYSINKDRLEIYTVGFRFIDKTEPPLAAKVIISEQKVSKIINLKKRQPITTLRIEPVEVAKIYPKHHQDRLLVKFDQIPPLLINTLLAIEDRRFYQHYGIDPLGILRAMWVNIRAGKIRQGASTLTQQLAKNFYLSHERTWWRKINEVIMALLLEFHYEKNDILEAYFNEVFLGQDGQRAIHGFGLASRYYFQTSIEKLRPEQMALLVGLVKGASYYNPYRHPERVKERRDIVLDQMASFRLITRSQALSYQKRSLGIKQHSRTLGLSRYPAFTEIVRQQLLERYRESDLRQAGLRIFTTLDPLLQYKAEQTLKEKIQQFEKQQKTNSKQLQGAVIISNAKSGEIQAVIGGRDDQKSGFNRALNAVRPIGSLIKPIVYLEALEQDYSLASVIKDEPIEWKDYRGQSWRPQNYDRTYHGDVMLNTALANSYNVATVRLGKQLGLASVIDRIKKLGFKREISAYPSLLLGTQEMSPYEVSQLYQPLVNDGFQIPLSTLRSVLDRNNQPLQHYDLNVEQVADPDQVYLLKTALQDVVKSGTARVASAILPRLMPLAGKTGTSDQTRDSWFAGFDDDQLFVIWLGRDDNQPTKLTGSSGALRVWIELMKIIPVEPINTATPETITWQWVNEKTGNLSAEKCTDSVQLPFRRNNLPKTRDDCITKQGIFDRIKEVLY